MLDEKDADQDVATLRRRGRRVLRGREVQHVRRREREQTPRARGIAPGVASDFVLFGRDDRSRRGSLA